MDANSEAGWLSIISTQFICPHMLQPNFWEGQLLYLLPLQNNGINSVFQGCRFVAYQLSVCVESIWKVFKKWGKDGSPVAYRLWGSLCVSVTLFTREWEREREPRSPGLPHFLPRKSEYRMSAVCLGTSVERAREWRDIKGRGCQDSFYFFFQARQKSLLQLALVWLSVKVEGKTPVE